MMAVPSPLFPLRPCSHLKAGTCAKILRVFVAHLTCSRRVPTHFEGVGTRWERKVFCGSCSICSLLFLKKERNRESGKNLGFACARGGGING